MANKFKLNTDEYNALSEGAQGFYKQDGESYLLNVEGATSSDKVKEFRENNIDLQKKLEAFDGVDLEKYKSIQEQERKLKDKELIDAGDIDGLIAQKTAAITSDFEAKINNLQSELDKSQGAYKSTVSKYEIEGAASKAFASHKISPDAQDAVMSQIRNKFTINEGSVVAMEGDKILTGENGNLTIDEFVGSQPEIFKVASNGGQGKGGHNHQETAKKTAAEKIAAGLESAEG